MAPENGILEAAIPLCARHALHNLDYKSLCKHRCVTYSIGHKDQPALTFFHEPRASGDIQLHIILFGAPPSLLIAGML